MKQPDILSLASSIFDSQPFSQHIGAELAEVTQTSTIIQVELRDALCQQHGYAHGGLLSYLADNAITFAGGIALSSDALTSEFKINYLKPGRGPLLSAKAEPIAVSGRQAVCQCHIYSVDGEQETLCAVAQGTVVRLSGDKT